MVALQTRFFFTAVANCLILLQVDASVGTEIGTMTEPDCLGPLDPGTAVSLEGIVWNETDGKYPSPLYWGAT